MMTVKVPNITKNNQLITKLHMDITDHIKVIQHKGQTFVRTYQGLDKIPTLPFNANKIITDEEEQDLAKIFVMLANIPQPTQPYYKLFMLNDLLRPQNMALWPVFELLESEEVNIMGQLATAKLKDWLVRHRNGDSEAPDDETQDIGDLEEEDDNTNQNNNNNDPLLLSPSTHS
ncbi:LOW QUALITY PROTEIN: hypothetical protein PoB_004493900 [Plakobranchus ocellatus]|uniref:Uncharacterized protein n=1 Tax=Plakobranchus ocellatus TaxID=259542 RepID=A0AAV4BJF2_9GAST|nr:LOW QUALITY PROTEIN: hypothetical protein PoB_004493900 [Plakobranchus ocellatus]